MDENQHGSPVFDPAEAARRLDLSGAGLRRLAKIYEDIFGKLPRDSRGGRLWTEEAIDRLSRARAMVQAGRSPSVEAVLVAEQAGEDVDFSPAPRSTSERLSATFFEEIRRLREAVEVNNDLLRKQDRRLEALEAASDATRSDLSASGNTGKGDAQAEPQTGAQNRPTIWSRWRRFLAGEPTSDNSREIGK